MNENKMISWERNASTVDEWTLDYVTKRIQFLTGFSEEGTHTHCSFRELMVCCIFTLLGQWCRPGSLRKEGCVGLKSWLVSVEWKDLNASAPDADPNRKCTLLIQSHSRFSTCLSESGTPSFDRPIIPSQVTRRTERGTPAPFTSGSYCFNKSLRRLLLYM